MMSILHVDLISCQYLIFYTSVVARAFYTHVRMLDILWLGTNFWVCTFEADPNCLVSITRMAFAEND